MACIVAYSGIEDVMKGMSFKKMIAKDPHASFIFVVNPHLPQVSNCVDSFLLLTEFR